MRPHHLASLFLLAALLPAGCETVMPPPPEELDLWESVSAGVENKKLAQHAAEY